MTYLLCGEPHRYWRRTVDEMRRRRRYRNEMSGRRCAPGCPCRCHHNYSGVTQPHPGQPCPNKKLDPLQQALMTLQTPPE